MKVLKDLEYVSVAETKARLSEKLRSVEGKGRRFAITSHGRPKAVLMGYMDYIAMTKGEVSASQEEMSFDKFKKRIRQRRGIIKSIASLFDETKLTRKGRKGYKRESVKKMERVARKAG